MAADYLSNRTQVVFVGGLLSDASPVLSGVPHKANSLDSGSASSWAHSLRTRAEIPSGPVALETSSFVRRRRTASGRKWMVRRGGASEGAGSGRSASTRSGPATLHFFEKKRANASAFSELVAHLRPSESTIRGISGCVRLPAALFNFVHHCLSLRDPVVRLRRRLASFARRDRNWVAIATVTELLNAC